MVFIVSLKCPFSFKAHFQSSPYNRGIEGCISLLWRVDMRQSVSEGEFRDIRVAVSFVVVSGLGWVAVWLVCLHVSVYSLP